jgi:catalase (peroxidase I)
MFRLTASIFSCICVFLITTSSNAQEFFALTDEATVSVVGAAMTELSDNGFVSMETTDDLGNVTTEELLVLDDSNLLRLNPQEHSCAIMSARITGTGGGSANGLVLLNDTDTLGDDWVPDDINDEDNWSGCDDDASAYNLNSGATRRLL